MQINLQQSARDLLEVLANLIHDREIKIAPSFCFNSNELLAIESWLLRLIENEKKDCICLDELTKL